MAPTHIVSMVIDKNKPEPYIVNVSYEDYQEWSKIMKDLLDCEYFEYHTISIKGERYTVICDEEGNLKEDKVCTVFQKGELPSMVMPWFVGNVLISRQGAEDCESLTEEDINTLMQRMMVNTEVGNAVLVL